MLHVGRANKSYFLLVLFAVWVLSPFAAGIYSNAAARHASRHVQRIVYIVVLMISLISVSVYARVSFQPGAKSAFPFLVTPAVSLFVLGITLILNYVSSSRTSKTRAP